MEQKPGWTYAYSENLKMYVAINDKTGVMYTEDKTMYTPEEASIIYGLNCEIPLEMHIIKKVFGGTLVQACIQVEELTEFDVPQ